MPEDSEHEDYRKWKCAYCGTDNAQWKIPRKCTNCGTPRGAAWPSNEDKKDK